MPFVDRASTLLLDAAFEADEVRKRAEATASRNPSVNGGMEFLEHELEVLCDRDQDDRPDVMRPIDDRGIQF